MPDLQAFWLVFDDAGTGAERAAQANVRRAGPAAMEPTTLGMEPTALAGRLLIPTPRRGFHLDPTSPAPDAAARVEQPGRNSS